MDYTNYRMEQYLVPKDGSGSVWLRECVEEGDEVLNRQVLGVLLRNLSLGPSDVGLPEPQLPDIGPIFVADPDHHAVIGNRNVGDVLDRHLHGHPSVASKAGTIIAVPDRSSKRPRDLNQLAARLVDEATSDDPAPEPVDPDAGKDPAAVALGRRGGLKGGKARAERMTPEERSEAARRAARARWSA